MLRNENFLLTAARLSNHSLSLIGWFLYFIVPIAWPSSHFITQERLEIVYQQTHQYDVYTRWHGQSYYSLFSPYTLNEWIHVDVNSCEILHLTVITCIESIAHNLVYLLAGLAIRLPKVPFLLVHLNLRLLKHNYVHMTTK